LISKQTIIQQPVIGLKARVVRSDNPSQIGISGEIIDETRNMLKILHKGKLKSIPKETSTLHLCLADGTIIEIKGEVLLGRPENRIRKEIRRKW
jgi:ribonuclease P protein subunit POP4